jgi:cytochrome c553
MGVFMKKIISAILFLILCAYVQAEQVYVTEKKCKACHFKVHTLWAKTKMAKSFELLKPEINAEEKTKAKLDPKKDYTTDAACLSCHTTGYGKKTGFTTLDKTPDLINVQCEACHGPGSDYIAIMKIKPFDKEKSIKAGLIIPDQKNCVTCHNKNNPFNPKEPFDFGKHHYGLHEHEHHSHK